MKSPTRHSTDPRSPGVSNPRTDPALELPQQGHSEDPSVDETPSQELVPRRARSERRPAGTRHRTGEEEVDSYSNGAGDPRGGDRTLDFNGSHSDQAGPSTATPLPEPATWDEDIRLKALFECERGQASTDQFRCCKCGQRKSTYFQQRTRCADEPMTTFITCVNCGARWKH